MFVRKPSNIKGFQRRDRPNRIWRKRLGFTPKREVVSPSLAGGAKHRDFTVNHGVFITIGPIIKLSECFHLAAPALTDCQMDSNTF